MLFEHSKSMFFFCRKVSRLKFRERLKCLLGLRPKLYHAYQYAPKVYILGSLSTLLPEINFYIFIIFLIITLQLSVKNEKIMIGVISIPKFPTRPSHCLAKPVWHLALEKISGDMKASPVY